MVRQHSDGQRGAAPAAGRLTLAVGPIVEVDHDLARVRINQADQQGSSTYWLLVMDRYSQSNAAYSLPDVDDTAIGLVDEDGETGVLLGCHYSEKAPPPETGEGIYYHRFNDGTEVEYDRNEHALKIKITDTNSVNLTVDAAGDVEISAKNLKVTCQELLEIITKKFILTIIEKSNISASAGFNIQVPQGSAEINSQAIATLGGVDTDGDVIVVPGQ